MRAMRQDRCANWRRISLRASSTMARYAYTAPVRMPNSRYLQESHVRFLSRHLRHMLHDFPLCCYLVNTFAAEQSRTGGGRCK